MPNLVIAMCNAKINLYKYNNPNFGHHMLCEMLYRSTYSRAQEKTRALEFYFTKNTWRMDNSIDIVISPVCGIQSSSEAVQYFTAGLERMVTEAAARGEKITGSYRLYVSRMPGVLSIMFASQIDRFLKYVFGQKSWKGSRKDQVVLLEGVYRSTPIPLLEVNDRVRLLSDYDQNELIVWKRGFSKTKQSWVYKVIQGRTRIDKEYEENQLLRGKRNVS